MVKPRSHPSHTLDAPSGFQFDGDSRERVSVAPMGRPRAATRRRRRGVPPDPSPGRCVFIHERKLRGSHSCCIVTLLEPGMAVSLLEIAGRAGGTADTRGGGRSTSPYSCTDTDGQGQPAHGTGGTWHGGQRARSALRHGLTAVTFHGRHFAPTTRVTAVTLRHSRHRRTKV